MYERKDPFQVLVTLRSLSRHAHKSNPSIPVVGPKLVTPGTPKRDLTKSPGGWNSPQLRDEYKPTASPSFTPEKKESASPKVTKEPEPVKYEIEPVKKTLDEAEPAKDEVEPEIEEPISTEHEPKPKVSRKPLAVSQPDPVSDEEDEESSITQTPKKAYLPKISFNSSPLAEEPSPEPSPPPKQDTPPRQLRGPVSPPTVSTPRRGGIKFSSPSPSPPPVQTLTIDLDKVPSTKPTSSSFAPRVSKPKGPREFPKTSVFGQEDDSEDEETDYRNYEGKNNASKKSESKLLISNSSQEVVSDEETVDPSVYAYDEVYDGMKAAAAAVSGSSKTTDKKVS